MDRTIIVGYDARPRSRDALALGALLANATGASLTVTYVFLAPATVEQVDEIAVNLFDDARRRLADAADRVPALHPEVVGHPGRSAADGLRQLCEERVAAGRLVDAVVLGSSEHGAAGRVLIGSTPERLLHGAPCPVAVAPAGYATAEPQRFAEIGVGYDGGPESEEALRTAAALAHRSGARLHPITAIPETPGLYVPGPLDSGEYAQYVATTRARHADTARTAIERLGAAGVDVVLEDPGGPAAEILAARSADLDLLVLGSRGHRPVRRVLLGSVATHLVRHSRCPLLVVPRAAVHADPRPAATDADRSAAGGMR